MRPSFLAQKKSYRGSGVTLKYVLKIEKREGEMRRLNCMKKGTKWESKNDIGHQKHPSSVWVQQWSVGESVAWTDENKLWEGLKDRGYQECLSSKSMVSYSWESQLVSCILTRAISWFLFLTPHSVTSHYSLDRPLCGHLPVKMNKFWKSSSCLFVFHLQTRHC